MKQAVKVVGIGGAVFTAWREQWIKVANLHQSISSSE